VSRHVEGNRVKRILVTGGAGFISSNMIRYLLESTRHEVVTMDALTYAGNLANLEDVMGHDRLVFIKGDIRNIRDVTEALDGIDVIVNAAAESHVSKSIAEGGAEFVTTNVVGTQVLLDAMREQQVERFVLISSSEVYGTAESDPMDEHHPLNPRSPYAGTKAGGDRLAYSYWCTYDMPITVIRPFNNYGPYQHPEKVIPRFIIQALTDQPLTIHGNGHASRDWLHVFDTAEAITAACEVPLNQIVGETINVATGVDESVEQIADMILEILDKPASLKQHMRDRPGQVDRHIGSTDKAADLLGWRSSIPFADGLERTVAWYRDNPQWWQAILAGDHAAQVV
jgi:dTDP-glucose 4,6-dehydratase